MLWSDFVALVKVDLPVDAKRIGVATGSPNFVDNKILQAVIQIQQLIEFYRGIHETTYGRDDLVVEGLASVGSLPQGQQCRPLDAFYKMTGKQCVSHPFVSYSWGNRYDLVCGNPRITNNQFLMAIDPTGQQFTCFPMVGVQHQIKLYWEGIKTSFADADETPFEADVAECVGYFVKGQISRLVDHDLNEYASYTGDYIRSRGLLYADTRERTRLSLTQTSEQPSNKCANSLAVCQDAGATCGTTEVEHEDTDEFVAFGDSGNVADLTDTTAVSALVKGLEPDFVMHMGDCLYPTGDPVNIQNTLLKIYGLYIPESFYLSFGNHDTDVDGGAALDALLTAQSALNAGERYYQIVRDYCSLFVLDAQGNVADQWAWLQAKVPTSALWNIVVIHDAPYTSETLHTPGNPAWRLPYETIGVDLVLSAHAHNYERLEVNGLPYIVCGLGGNPKRGFISPALAGSQYRYSATNGCLWVTARENVLQTSLYSVAGTQIDSLAIQSPTAVEV